MITSSTCYIIMTMMAVVINQTGMVVYPASGQLNSEDGIPRPLCA